MKKTFKVHRNFTIKPMNSYQEMSKKFWEFSTTTFQQLHNKSEPNTTSNSDYNDQPRKDYEENGQEKHLPTRWENTFLKLYTKDNLEKSTQMSSIIWSLAEILGMQRWWNQKFQLQRERERERERENDRERDGWENWYIIYH